MQNVIVPNANVTNKILIPSWEIFPSYVNAMNKYLIHFSSTTKFKNGDNDNIYLLLNGFTTLTHVFKIILRETLDPEEAAKHTIDAIFYYTQCIEQFEESKTEDLDVSSNIASIFVYKKTIHKIPPERDLSMTATEEDLTIIKNVEDLIQIYKQLAEFIIDKQYDQIVPEQAMELCKPCTSACACVSSSVSSSTEKEYHAELTSIIAFISHFPVGTKIYDYAYLYVKKYKHIQITFYDLLMKRAQPVYQDKLNDKVINNYIKWLLA